MTADLLAFTRRPEVTRVCHSSVLDRLLWPILLVLHQEHENRAGNIQELQQVLQVRTLADVSSEEGGTSWTLEPQRTEEEKASD